MTTAERDTRIRELRAQGLKFSQIAAEVGEVSKERARQICNGKVRANKRDAEPVIQNRDGSSMFVLTERLRQCIVAFTARDEAALRGELKHLEMEARLLRQQTPLLADRAASRRRLCLEADGPGRLA